LAVPRALNILQTSRRVRLPNKTAIKGQCWQRYESDAEAKRG